MGEPKPTPDYIHVPYTPQARFALRELHREPGIRQVHPLAVSEEARQNTGVIELSLHVESMTTNGNYSLTNAAELLHRGQISDHAFVTLFERRHGVIMLPPEHEVFSIYNQHVGEIIEAMERTAGATKIVFSCER